MKHTLLLLLAVITINACGKKLTADYGWAEKKWVLLELQGVPVQVSGTDKDAHLVFNAKERSYYGTGGCNRLRGMYEMGAKNHLKFSAPAGTKMACADLPFEQRFFEVLNSVDKYVVDGNALLLQSAGKVVMKLQ
ncbi:MAG: hypothetical protein RL172_1045 [Bacteroidota bacterium]|jgi:heat shock protein HslJ